MNAYFKMEIWGAKTPVLTVGTGPTRDPHLSPMEVFILVDLSPFFFPLSLASASQNHPASRQCSCMCVFPELLLSEVPRVLPHSQEEGVP